MEEKHGFQLPSMSAMKRGHDRGRNGFAWCTFQNLLIEISPRESTFLKRILHQHRKARFELAKDNPLGLQPSAFDRLAISPLI